MFLPSNITLKFGDSGDFVAEMQRRLAIVKCLDEKAANGFFDGATVNAVTLFQSQQQLRADGVADPATLTRLNNLIAGTFDDTARTEESEDEKEDKKAKGGLAAGAAALLMPGAVAAAPAINLEALAFNPPSQQQQTTASQPQLQSQIMQPQLQPQQPAYVPPPPPRNDMPPVNEQQMINEQVRAQNMATQAQHRMMPPPSDQLASMLQNPQQHQHGQHPHQPQNPQQQPGGQQPPNPNQQPQGDQQQQPGLMGRAIRFGNAMMQKIADYIEAKLPNSALREVQQIGQAMASAGVREAPIPTGPEMVPQQQTPGIQQQPQQQPQRG